MFDNFGFTITKIFKDAELERYNLNHPYVGSEHLLLAILKNNNVVSKKLKNYDLTYDKFKDELIKIVGMACKKSELNLYTPLLKRIILNAIDDAKENNKGIVTENHLLISLLEEGEGIAIRLMLGMDIDLDKLYKDLKNTKKDNKKLEIFEVGKLLNTYVDNSETVVGRDKEIEMIIETLLRKKKNNPLLVGKAGVGKTAIVEEFTRRINNAQVPLELQDKKIVSLEMGSLVAGTKYRGEFEEKLTKIIKEIKEEKNIILFIDEIHTMVNAGGAEGAINAGDILKPYLARGDIKCIGATTINEYNKTILKDKALDRRFELINVLEPDTLATKDILMAIKEEYEKHHQIKITEQNINDIVFLANKYIHTKANPDKTIDLLDTVCAKVKSKIMINKDKKTLEEKLDNIKNLKKQSVLDNDFQKALTLRNEELKIIESLSKDSVIKGYGITKEDIFSVIENKSNIPLLENKDLVFNRIKKSLAENIIGQDNAIAKVLTNIKVYLNNPNKPLSVLLCGPSGVGKTQTVKTIAQAFNKKSKLIRLDMSEYNLETSINKLIGVSAGYVGYDDEYIFSKVKLNPYSIILLDEIEKAHPKVMNLFLQILDEGFVTDCKGEKIYFDNTMIFMTTNIVNHTKVGFNNIDNYSLEEILAPELIGRIDDIINYDSITKEVVKNYLLSLNLDKNIDIEKIIRESNYQKYGLRNITKVLKKEEKFITN